MQIKYKQILFYSAMVLALFFFTEYILDYFFNDNTPKWKIFVASFISTAVMVYPFVNRERTFHIRQILANQHGQWLCIQTGEDYETIFLKNFSSQEAKANQ